MRTHDREQTTDCSNSESCLREEIERMERERKQKEEERGNGNADTSK